MKKITIFAVNFLVSMVFIQNVLADPDVDQMALAKTQNALRDPVQRQEEIKLGGKKAQEANDYAKGVAGNSQNLDAMYEFAARVMPKLVQETNGDPDKMQALLADMQKDPSKFKSLLTPELQRELSSIVGNVEKSKAPTPH